MTNWFNFCKKGSRKFSLFWLAAQTKRSANKNGEGFYPTSQILIMFKLERQVFVQNQLDEDYYDDYEEDEGLIEEDLDEEIAEEDEL